MTDVPGQVAGPATDEAPAPRGPGHAGDGLQVQVRAAGAVCWRRAKGEGHEIEVLVVHRPRYDDWSWPKGKVHPGEPEAVCAVRETAEETGLQVVLGPALPPVGYRLADGRHKQVSLWSAQVRHQVPGFVTDGEVDAVQWLPVTEAAERLTHPDDVQPLRALDHRLRGGEAATRPFLVIRHASARPRHSWARSDAERPLVAAGRRQALALASLLGCWRPELIVSSPWLRCLESVEPYLALSGARLRTKGGLSESGYRRNPAKAAGHARRLLGSGRSAGICTHRPVLPAVLEVVAEFTVAELADQVPSREPYLAAGEVLVAHVHADRKGRPRIAALERHVAPR